MIDHDVNDCGWAAANDDLMPERESYLASWRHGT
jgi:hypothetical protein